MCLTYASSRRVMDIDESDQEGTTVRVAKTDDKPSTSSTALWDIEAVAHRLGVEVRHIRRLVNERRIPFIKWGHLLRFDPAEIEAWLDSARKPAQR